MKISRGKPNQRFQPMTFMPPLRGVMIPACAGTGHGRSGTLAEIRSPLDNPNFIRYSSPMIRPLADVTRDAIELPQDQRLTLARILLDVTDLPSEPIADVDSSWEQEISERIKTIDSGSSKGRPWEDVLKDINLRFAQ